MVVVVVGRQVKVGGDLTGSHEGGTFLQGHSVEWSSDVLGHGAPAHHLRTPSFHETTNNLVAGPPPVAPSFSARLRRFSLGA